MGYGISLGLIIIWSLKMRTVWRDVEKWKYFKWKKLGGGYKMLPITCSQFSKNNLDVGLEHYKTAYLQQWLHLGGGINWCLFPLYFFVCVSRFSTVFCSITFAVKILHPIVSQGTVVKKILLYYLIPLGHRYYRMGCDQWKWPLPSEGAQGRRDTSIVSTRKESTSY